MPPLITFIGWHNSGKTTLASKVVARLKALGFRVGTIKSTKETNIEPENSSHTDTAKHWRAGADGVVLAAPDQVFVRYRDCRFDVKNLTSTFFSGMDLVIAEGFKHAVGVPKIEVRRDDQAPLLRDQVDGVIAVATDLADTGLPVFTLDQVNELTDFILVQMRHQEHHRIQALQLVFNDQSVPLPPDVNQEVATLLHALRQTGTLQDGDTLELRVTRTNLPAATAPGTTLNSIPHDPKDNTP